MIKIENLTKVFTKDGYRVEVLKGLTLEIKKGESVAIVGVSGAGKSTLLHILGTLDRPTSGTLSFDGVDIFRWDERKLADFRNRKIGFVFQFHHLLPEFSALENTMMPALIHGIAKRDARKKAEAILRDVGLGDRMNHKPGELSGGEQQRVAVGRALVMDPEIMLADEPTGNLDTETGKVIHDMMVQLNRKRNLTLVVVTHNKALADQMSLCIGLRDGRIVSDE
jgi:lipoprotein-releasing system ATP-binding protein